jgi:hypothetical protein
VKIPARAPLMKQAQRTQVSPGPQVPLRGLAYEVGALGAQPGRPTESLDGTRTVDYSRARVSMQAGDAPSSAMSERLVGDGRLRLTGRNDARCTGFHGIRRTRATRCRRHIKHVRSCLSTVRRPDRGTVSGAHEGDVQRHHDRPVVRSAFENRSV